MNKIFRTISPETRFPFEISYGSKIMFLGSCFTENIGNRMDELKFDTLVNPFGIMFNPISVKRTLQYIAGEAEFSRDDLVFHNELWHSMHHHGDFSRTRAEDTLELINNSIEYASDFLKKADVLFLTFGTAWAHEYKKTLEIVANCHKIPETEFVRRMLDSDEILVEYFQLMKILNNVNPNLKIVFTISPVRHLANGLTGNFFSKSTLAVAVQQLLKMYEDENMYYFPAYEIQHDDLRDYRFYDSDMVHPSKDATDYIFEYFKTAFIRPETENVIKQIESIVRAYNHRPFNTDTESYMKFKSNTLAQIKSVLDKYPSLNFEEEISYFA